MVEWGWSKRALYVDRSTATLYLGDDKVLSSSVEGSTFKVDFGPGWKEDLQDDRLDDIFNKSQGKLTTKFQTKGGGKGAEKGKGKARGKGGNESL